MPFKKGEQLKHGYDHVSIYDSYGYKNEKSDSSPYVSMLEENMDDYRKFCSWARYYPDLFLDLIKPVGSNFELYFYQRIFLRIIMRYKYVYATFSRAFSKSFLSILAFYLRCVFFPGVRLFIASGGKAQASNIVIEKVEEIQNWFPALRREVQEIQKTKDYVKLVFHNGSKLDIVAVQNSTRGGRRHGGIADEVILIDGQKLSEVVIPLMNIDRRAANGKVDRDEIHQNQVFLTSAGYKNTFAYQKMIQLLVWQVVRGNAFVFGGDWHIPVMHDMLNPGFINELKSDGTYNSMSFSREYESIWSGTSEDAFFNGDIIDRCRLIKEPETKPDTRNKNVDYIIATDVARLSGKQNATTVAMVIKRVHHKNTTPTKHIVSMKVFDGEHFEMQSIRLKKLMSHWDAKQLIVDANGLGVGLVDYLVKSNTDPGTGEILPPYSVTNDDELRYLQYKTEDSLPLLYNVKAGVGNSSLIHVNCLTQISSDKVRFLIDETTAKARYLANNAKKKESKDISSIQMNVLLAPHLLTSILKDEMLNLARKAEGKNIILERINKKIGKDKFSALEYGLWWCKIQEDKAIKKKQDVDSSAFLFIKKPVWTKSDMWR